MPVAAIPAAGIAALVAIGLAVAAVAGYLIAIGLVLRKVSSGLNAVIASLDQIVGRTQPIEPVVSSITRDLAGARKLLEELLVAKTGRVPAPRAAPQAAQSTTTPSPESVIPTAEPASRIVYRRPDERR